MTDSIYKALVRIRETTEHEFEKTRHHAEAEARKTRDHVELEAEKTRRHLGEKLDSVASKLDRLIAIAERYVKAEPWKR